MSYLDELNYKECSFQDSFIEKSLSNELRVLQYEESDKMPKKRGRKKGVPSKKKFDAHPKTMIKFLDYRYPLMRFSEKKKEIIHSVRVVEENMIKIPSKRGRKKKTRKVDKNYKTNMKFMLDLAFKDKVFELDNEKEFIDKVVKEWEDHFTSVKDPYVFDVREINGKKCYINNDNYVFDKHKNIIGLIWKGEYINLDIDEIHEETMSRIKKICD